MFAGKYVVPRVTRELVDHTGLRGIIKELRQDLDLTWSSRNLQQMIEGNLFKEYPGFEDRAKSVMWNKHPFSPWRVKRGKTVDIPASKTDELIFSGYVACRVLMKRAGTKCCSNVKDEFWKHEGFDSPVHMFGALGTYLFGRDKQADEWVVESDGRIHSFRVGVDVGVAVSKTDITPYETVDPFGNSVQYRPLTSDDKEGIFFPEGSEIYFFAVVMNYFRQKGLRPSEEVMEYAEEGHDLDHAVNEYFTTELSTTPECPSIYVRGLCPVVEEGCLAFYSRDNKLCLSLPQDQMNDILFKIMAVHKRLNNANSFRNLLSLI